MPVDKKDMSLDEALDGADQLKNVFAKVDPGVFAKAYDVLQRAISARDHVASLQQADAKAKAEYNRVLEETDALRALIGTLTAEKVGLEKTIADLKATIGAIRSKLHGI